MKRRTEYQRILSDLRAKKFTLTDIAAVLGVAASTIGDLNQGATKAPRSETAHKLRELHKQYCGKPDREPTVCL